MASNVKLNPVGVAVILMIGAGAMYLFGFPRFHMYERKINLKELLAVGIHLAEHGGDEVRTIRKNADKDLNAEVKGKTKEGMDELKTNGDMASHRVMTFGFKKAYPGLNVISEERDTETVDLNKIDLPDRTHPELSNLPDLEVPTEDLAVWIDPLDATQEYTENLVKYVTTMVCVAVKGQPTLGVIHLPFTKETYWAWVGKGHTKKLEDSSESRDSSPPGKNRIIVSRSHSGPVEKVAKDALGADTEVIPAGGAGYKTLQVIKGEADAYVHVTLIKKWDICAGNAIIESVGGKMTTLENNPIDYSGSGSVRNENGLLATTKLHKVYLEKLKPAADAVKKEPKSKHKQKREIRSGRKKISKIDRS